MSSILFSLPELYNAYKTWVSKNPQSLSDYETSAKWISYFIAGRINNSQVVSELIYCLSNLLVLFNDRIINNSFNIVQTTSVGETIKLWLTVLEYSEVFLELSAKKLWGETGKWLIVIAIQVLKCISRLILIYRHKENIIQTPPIPILERKKLPKSGTNSSVNASSVDDVAQLESFSFTLKRSGRTVRKVDSSPPIGLRNWKPLQHIQEADNREALEQALAGKQLIAETIYVTKPLVHLATMACFGQTTWKPWMISLIMDLASLQLYGSCRNNKISYLTPKQRLQLSRRTVVLLLYLLRSPFYEKYSKDKINAVLDCLSHNLPLAGLICKPLIQYIPFWQSNYFYMWST